jgi:hypothetical protein
MFLNNSRMEPDILPRSKDKVIVVIENLEAIGRRCREHPSHRVQRPMGDLLRYSERAGPGVDPIDDYRARSSARYDVFDREHLFCS